MTGAKLSAGRIDIIAMPAAQGCLDSVFHDHIIKMKCSALVGGLKSVLIYFVVGNQIDICIHAADEIRKLAEEEGSCVIVGRCADYILRDLPYATNVFIYAEEADKIKRAIEEYGVPEESVRKLMKDTDKARANYYAYHTGRKWGDPVNYHFSLDSGYLEVEDIVDIIIEYTNRQIRRGTTIWDK